MRTALQRGSRQAHTCLATTTVHVLIHCPAAAGAALLLASMLLSPAAASAPTPALSFAAACSPYDGPSGRLYFLDMSTETGTWDDAKSYCTARYGWGATVAKIDSDAQFSLLREFVTNLQVGCWVGGGCESDDKQLMPLIRTQHARLQCDYTACCVNSMPRQLHSCLEVLTASLTCCPPAAHLLLTPYPHPHAYKSRAPARGSSTSGARRAQTSPAPPSCSGAPASLTTARWSSAPRSPGSAQGTCTGRASSPLAAGRARPPCAPETTPAVSGGARVGWGCWGHGVSG